MTTSPEPRPMDFYVTGFDLHRPTAAEKPLVHRAAAAV